MITIELRYSLIHFNDLDEKLSNLVISLNGTVANSGAGFGYRDMEIDFLSKIDLNEFLARIQNLRHLISINILL